MGNSNRIEREQMNSNYTTQQLGQFMGIVKNSISQNDTCRILKFNSKNSLLFTGSETKIKMHAFHKGQLHKICELYHSNLSLTYLNCKKDTILISGCDKMIIMRTLIGINNKKVLRKIIVNDNNFSCFAISEQNNLLVAGLYKHIYFFWQVNCEWIFKQDLESIDGIDWAYSLSFNESQNKLISCYGNNKIAIIQQLGNQVQQWKIVQIINIDNFVNQAIFFGDDSFVIHPWMSKNMLVYKFNQQKDVFTLLNTFLMEGEGQFGYSFTSLYIKQRLLFIKQDKNQLCLFQINKNSELQLFQRIRFQERNIWGTMSDDGLWLITWDEASKQLKVISCFLN